MLQCGFCPLLEPLYQIEIRHTSLICRDTSPLEDCRLPKSPYSNFSREPCGSWQYHRSKMQHPRSNVRNDVERHSSSVLVSSIAVPHLGQVRRRA